MATFNKFESFVEAVGEEKHNFESDILKVALSNTAPSAGTDSTLSDITQISAGNGYTTGGNTISNSTYTESSGTATLDGDDVVFTASGGAMANFRYAIIYNDSAPSDELIGYVDYGSEVTLADTETLTVGFDASGILTVG